MQCMFRFRNKILFFLVLNVVALATTVYAQTTVPETPEVQDIAFNKIISPNVAHFLEWITDTNKANLCGGHYLEPPEFAVYQNVPLPKNSPVKITAKKTVLLAENGESELHGDVTMTEPGREIVAQKVTLYRDGKSGEVKNGALFGDVHLREPGKLIVANTGDWDFTNKIITFNEAIYHMITESPTGIVSAWGRAKQAVRDALGIWKLHSVSYTTCAPTTNSWEIDSSRLTLDRNEGWGSSVNTLFYVKDVPVFYMPYFRFPIDKRRKSGFLYPAFGYSSVSGTKFSLPYYFNLATNYDFTLTPQFYSRRGVLTEGTFRYLTDESNGILDVGYIPHDSVFTQFRDSASANYAPSHALSRLMDASDDRGFISLHHQSFFGPKWSSQLDLNYVSDDYMLRDFASAPTVRDNDQLLDQLDVDYLSDHWQFLGRLQAFQTLHLLTDASMAADQYQRLPQLDLNGDFPDEKYGLNYQINTEFVNFDHNHDFVTGDAFNTGQRGNVQPGIDLPFNWSSIYIDPKLQLPTTFYALKPQLPYTQDDITRVLPIFSVDSGMFFNRDINFIGNKYTQTLEPRLFYLFVPRLNQDDIPLFDTLLPAFNFEQLFRSNRFSGLDRIGDADQIAFALTTRFLDSYTAEEKMHISVGQIYQLRRHTICINDDCTSDPLANSDFSPLVGEMQYSINPRWSATGDLAWDAHDKRVSTGDVGVSYNDNAHYIFNLGYNFVRNGDPSPDQPNDDLKRINTSLSWLLKERWHVIGSWNYNISHARPETYLYGIQYDNCCWAIRVVQSRTFTGVDPSLQNQYDKTIYLQFLLKGLGNVGTSDAGGLLAGSIGGYQDDFASGFKL